MIANLTTNQPSFKSKIRMSERTAKALNSQAEYIKHALNKELLALSSNGRNDIVKVSFKEQVSRSICPTFFKIYDEKVLGLDILEKRGDKYFSSKAKKIINVLDENFNGPLNIMDLYRTARKDMRTTESVANNFMKYV